MSDESGDIVFPSVHIVIDFWHNLEVVTFYQLRYNFIETCINM